MNYPNPSTVQSCRGSRETEVLKSSSKKGMKTDFAFWDTSAIVPLCYHLPKTTAASRRLRKKYSKSAVWWGTEVEISSSLARLLREGTINGHGRILAFRHWRSFCAGARVIDATNRVLSIAVELPNRYGLRALDSFQLAAALEWCGERPRNRPFITADHRLGRAADDSGFDVISL